MTFTPVLSEVSISISLKQFVKYQFCCYSFIVSFVTSVRQLVSREQGLFSKNLGVGEDNWYGSVPSVFFSTFTLLAQDKKNIQPTEITCTIYLQTFSSGTSGWGTSESRFSC